MRVLIAADGAVTLDDADDCRSFSVGGAPPGSDEATAAVVAAGVHLDAGGGHAYVEPAAVERLAAGRVDEGWGDRFAAMLAYAGTKGWLDEVGRIRGHTEWAS